MWKYWGFRRKDLCVFFFLSFQSIHFRESAQLLIPSTYASYNVNLITKYNSAFLCHFLLFQIFIRRFLTRFLLFLYLLLFRRDKKVWFSSEFETKAKFMVWDIKVLFEDIQNYFHFRSNELNLSSRKQKNEFQKWKKYCYFPQ